MQMVRLLRQQTTHSYNAHIHAPVYGINKGNEMLEHSRHLPLHNSLFIFVEDILNEGMFSVCRTLVPLIKQKQIEISCARGST